MKKTFLIFSLFSLFPSPFSLSSAQPTTRIATNVEALTSTPVFFHGRQVVVRQPITGSVELTRLDNTSKPIFVFLKEPPGAVRDAELRGEFWDLGRLQPDDSRFSSYNFDRVLEAASSGQWPARDRVFVILNATLSEAPLPPAPTIRAIVLAPERYVDREVRISGRFRGRNLHGDLPQPLNKDRWDFVLQSADASIWISGMRPKGKDFELDPSARVDTGKWLEITGVVQRKGAQLWVEASSIRPTSAPSDVPVEVVVPVRPVEAPPSVIFTAPVQDDTEVERGAPVRIQFSRDLTGASIANRVRVSYTSAAPGAQPPAPPAFTAVYQEGTRSIEIKFAQPLERFSAVKVELLEGITAFDGQPLAPFTLTFTTGP
ncbi:MAG: Ig-like domain-containing protein [Vicinamibacterales bacterium]